MRLTGTDSVRALLEFLVAWSSSYDVGHVFVTAGVATVLQLLPLCNGARAHTHTHSHTQRKGLVHDRRSLGICFMACML
jgi:hypothetical protein